MAEFPKTLWLVRHGESVGNVARHRAEAGGMAHIDEPCREPDVELSTTGVEQAKALGRWFSPQSEKPAIIYISPYKRAIDTAGILLETSAIMLADGNIRSDERLRERELGVFDRLTKQGALEKFPDLCDLRERWGKFYFRPPGGESWADVVLRLRSFIRSDFRQLADQNVLIVTHEVVIRCFRYVLEDMSESQILEIDRASDVANGAITEYKFDPLSRKLRLEIDNIVPDS